MRNLLALVAAFGVAAGYLSWRRREEPYWDAMRSSASNAADKVEAAAEEVTKAASDVADAASEAFEPVTYPNGPRQD